MTSRQGREERQFSRQDGATDHLCQLRRIGTGRRCRAALQAEQLRKRGKVGQVGKVKNRRVRTYLQTGALWAEHGSATNGANFDRRHRTRNVQIIVVGFHDGDAVRAAHRLGRILRATSTLLSQVSNWKELKEHLPGRLRCKWQPQCWLPGHCCLQWSRPWLSRSNSWIYSTRPTLRPLS